jgi:hypothetical protein
LKSRDFTTNRDKFRQVTPNVNHSPKRTYVHDGCGKISCCEVRYVKETIGEPVVARGGPLFEFTLTPHRAQELMEDLFIGENNGSRL